jgi:hypothetical protein
LDFGSVYLLNALYCQLIGWALSALKWSEFFVFNAISSFLAHL